MKREELIESNLAKRFITFPNEQVVTVVRKHWLVLLFPLSLCLLTALGSMVAAWELFVTLLLYKSLFILSLFATLLCVFGAFMKIIIDWHSHLYIVTSHKLLEVCYAPLFSHTINQVLLDQVRCTEVDISIGGIVQELTGVGNVTITFDRPTHQEEFTLGSIGRPNEVGALLADALVTIPYQVERDLWFKTREQKYRFYQEIQPKTPMGGDIYVSY